MGGKSSADNSEVVALQKEQAAEARQKEADRQARIDQGLAGIKGAFEGAPVMGSRAGSYDWSKYTAPAAQGLAGVLKGLNASGSGSAVSGLPAGYTSVQVADPKAAASTASKTSVQPPRSGGYHGENYNSYNGSTNGLIGDGGRNGPPVGAGGGNSGNGSNWIGNSAAQGAGANNGAGKVWAIQGPDGKIYYQGDNIPTTESYDTGEKSGGFASDFYDKFRQGILDYYTPQVADQYADAKDELTYRLARAGTLRSSIANDETADLSKQNDLNVADVYSKADTGAADLRSRVAGERAKAESQLYATEDPTVAINQALTGVRNLSLDKPNLSTLGDIFKVAAIGGANVVTGFKNQNMRESISGYNSRGSNRTVGG